MNFVGAGARLSTTDIAVAAQALGCEAAAIKAVIAVETTGSGFDAQMRPRMLFEPHVFYRVLAKRRASDFTAAIAQGLAYPNWGALPYPADSYPRLVAACAIDEEAALRATSWGLGQVLAENFAAAGCTSAEDLVEQAIAGEGNQLRQMVAFISSAHLAPALRAHDWVMFAEGYNGRSEARQGYHLHLAAAYARFAGGLAKPTPAPIAVPAVTQHELSADELNARFLAEHPTGLAA